MRTTLLRFIFLPVFALSTSILVLGQDSTTTLPAKPANVAGTKPDAAKPISQTTSDYSAEPAVIEHLDSLYKMAADGTGVRQTTMAVHIQTDAAVRQLGIVMIGYAGDSERVEMAYVRVRHPDGTVTETPVSEAIEMPQPITQQAPFYSDLKQMQLPVRNLSTGDTLEWQVKIIKTKAEAAGQFWGQENFTDDSVILSRSLELRVPKDKAVTVWSPNRKPEELVDGEERVYRWMYSQRKPTVGKEADADRELKKKQIWTAEQEIDAKEGKLPSVAWTTFKSWEEVGMWYRGAEGDRATPNASVKAKVAELVAGKTSDEEKARAVYHYVATQIRYIGVAFGIGRYQPHRAEEVLANQYGDCKDKHTLLAAMLYAIGMHPDAVLIGAGVRFNEAVPSPSSFNHLITRITMNGQPVWLDSTAEVAPYRALTYTIRDEKALVIPQTGTAKIQRTPGDLPFPSSQTMSAVGVLDKEGTSNSRLVLTARGDEEILLRAAFRQTSPAQYDQLVQQISQGMSYAGTASHAEVSRPEDTTEPIKISYDYKREKNGDWDNLKIVPQLPPVFLPGVDEKDPPVQAISLGVPRVETSTSVMKLPDGWGVELPEAIHQRSVYGTYDETYRFEKGSLYAERRIEVLQQKVPVSDWKTYKKWAEDADLAHEQWVQLITNERASPMEEEQKTPVAGNAEAEKKVARAYEEAAQLNLSQAKAMLDQAQELNPKQPHLWSTYGFYESQRGEMAAAILDYQKEISLYPERYETYASLGQAQIKLGRREDAKETMRKWAAVDAQNPAPSIHLVNLLLADKDGAGAIAAIDAEMRRLPEVSKDERMQFLKGRAELMSGMRDKGRLTLLVLMQTTKNSGLMNDCSYELADAGLELSAAESAARVALGVMVDESVTWSLDQNQQMLRAKSRLIEATWDTLGWVLYREGKFEESEGYLKAAWLNRQSATSAEHLGDLYAALGKKDEALTTYELGIETATQHDPKGAKKPAGIEETKLVERANTLRKDGAKSSVQNARGRLQQISIIPLGAANGIEDAAEYRLILSGDRITGSAPAWVKDLSDAKTKLKEAHLTGFIPAGSKANLARNGTLTCRSGACELVLAP